jgi:type IX secretion system PorP/SprF family membrane protein
VRPKKHIKLKTNKYILILLIAVVQSMAIAQDVDFSQFFAAPLYVNPALTGNMECHMRAGTVYRDQWRTVGNPYVNKVAFLESKIFHESLGESWIGAGGSFYNNTAGDGNLSNTRGMLQGSFHKGLLDKNELFVSVGAGLGIANKSIDMSGLSFDSQWDGHTFNMLLASDEPYKKTSIYYADMIGGITVTYMPMPVFGKTPHSIFIGLAGHHLNKPHDTFYDSDNRIGIKTIIHSGAVLYMNETIIQPGFYHATQKNAKEFMLGSNFIFRNKGYKLFAGAWYRSGSDLILAGGVEKKKYTLMFSYDLTLSRMRLANAKKGGFEVTITKSFRCDPRRATPSGFNFFQYPNFIIQNEAPKYQKF